MSEDVKPPPTEPTPAKPCRLCANYRHGATTLLCASPNFPQPEPLFWAILKCGPQRDFFVDKPF